MTDDMADNVNNFHLRLPVNPESKQLSKALGELSLQNCKHTAKISSRTQRSLRKSDNKMNAAPDLTAAIDELLGAGKRLRIKSIVPSINKKNLQNQNLKL